MDGSEGLSFGATGCKSVKRPRQNRCTPFGSIEATPHRGTLMGNRGDLHAEDGTLGKRWRSRRWICCVLEGFGWKAPMDEPGRNYPLFFYDETVALAAGHRPCGQCRSDALAAFIAAWKVAHGYQPHDWVPLQQIDAELHRARIGEWRRRTKVELSRMPDGAYVWLPTIDQRPMMVRGNELLPWEHAGFAAPVSLKSIRATAYALSPSPIIKVLKAGYEPITHPELQRVATAMPR